MTEIDKTLCYYKITNSHQTNTKYQYLTEFDDNPNNQYCANGLNFTTLNNIDKFYHNGIFLQEISLSDDPDLKVIKNGENSWRSNMIILGNKYPLYDVETLKIFNIPLTIYLIELAAEYGRTDTLQWIYDNSNLEFSSASNAINFASKNGHTNVLDWFLEMDIDFNYSEFAIDWAAMNGHAHVLNWFQDNCLEIRYSYNAIDQAAKFGHISILNWLKQNRYKIIYSDAILFAARAGHTNVLNWFKQNGFDIKLEKWELDEISDNVYNWIMQNV